MHFYAVIVIWVYDRVDVKDDMQKIGPWLL